jgi:hypothetical protein
LTIVLTILLQFMASDYPFGIFKHFIHQLLMSWWPAASQNLTCTNEIMCGLNSKNCN